MCKCYCKHSEREPPQLLWRRDQGAHSDKNIFRHISSDDQKRGACLNEALHFYNAITRTDSTDRRNKGAIFLFYHVKTLEFKYFVNSFTFLNFWSPISYYCMPLSVYFIAFYCFSVLCSLTQLWSLESSFIVIY